MENLLKPSAFAFSEIFKNVTTDCVLYAVLGVTLILLGCFCFFYKKPERNTLSSTQRLCYTAILTAVATLSNFLSTFPVQSVSISLVWTVCFISALLLGAKSAFIVGFVGDLIGAIIFPFGVYNPLIGIASGLLGFIPGVIFDNFKGNTVVKTVISAVITFLVCTVCINTFALWVMYAMGKKSFFAYLFARLPMQTLITMFNVALSLALAKFLPKALKNTKFNIEK